jgi:hypothetical protein
MYDVYSDREWEDVEVVVKVVSKQVVVAVVT